MGTCLLLSKINSAGATTPLPFMLHVVRHFYALVTGILLVYYPFGTGITQVVLPLSLTYGAMALMPSQCGKIAWLNMVYLIWL